jgi:hypothetical protein
MNQAIVISIALLQNRKKTGCAVKSQTKLDLFIVGKSQPFTLGLLNPQFAGNLLLVTLC